MNNGFYKLNSVVLGFDIANDINKIRFNHYIMRKENIQRLQGTLPRGQFYMTVRRTATDLQLSISTISRLVREFSDLGVIRLVSKGAKGKMHSIYSYISSEISEDLFDSISENLFDSDETIDFDYDSVENYEFSNLENSYGNIENKGCVDEDCIYSCGISKYNSIDENTECSNCDDCNLLNSKNNSSNKKSNDLDSSRIKNNDKDTSSNNENINSEKSTINFTNTTNKIKNYTNKPFIGEELKIENDNLKSRSSNINFNETYNGIDKITKNDIEDNQSKNVVKSSNIKVSSHIGRYNKKSGIDNIHDVQKEAKFVTNKKESLNKFNKKNIQQSIINMLNKKTGKNFKINSPTSIKLINERLKEGYVLEDFYKVIEVKVAKWKDTIMEMYIRPETLFSHKFESYVNENISVKNQRSVYQFKKSDNHNNNNYIYSDYTTYDDSKHERKKHENVRYWNPICEF
ncbi:conserved phage C-terminal domain-containing protein [Clostridioides difficile]|nr:conserved phage C-terminal domain-containing protein [Clostridioides difficile]